MLNVPVKNRTAKILIVTNQNLRYKNSLAKGLKHLPMVRNEIDFKDTA